MVTSRVTSDAPAPPRQPGKPWHRIALFLLFGLTLAGFGWLYLQCVETEFVGMIPDDGVYTILGKALATGEGYRLIHLVTAPPHLKYPILYPAVLAVGWLLNPHFPENLALLSQITLGFFLGTLGLLFFYLRRVKAVPSLLAWLICILVGCNYFILYYGTSLMSESLYLFLSLSTIYAAERYLLQNPTSRQALALTMLLSVLTFHTRMIGLTLILSIGLLLFLRKQWKSGLLYTGGALLLTVLPWQLWTFLNQPQTTGTLNPTIANIYSNYSMEFLEHYTAGDYLQRFIGTLGSYTATLMENLFPLVNHLFEFHPMPGLVENPSLVKGYLILLLLFTYGLLGYYLLLLISMLKRSFAQRTTTLFSVSGLYLVLYSIAILFWSYDDQTSRFIAMLTPWLWYYLFLPYLPALKAKGLKAWPQLLAIVVISFLALESFPLEYRFVHQIRVNHWMDTGKYPILWQEYQAAFAFIQGNTPPHTPLGTGRDTLFYLYTGHPTFHVSAGSIRMIHNMPDKAAFPELMSSLRHYQVGYLIIEPQTQAREIKGMENRVARALVDQYPKQFQLLYTTPFGMIKIFKILPPSLHEAIFLPSLPHPR